MVTLFVGDVDKNGIPFDWGEWDEDPPCPDEVQNNKPQCFVCVRCVSKRFGYGTYYDSVGLLRSTSPPVPHEGGGVRRVLHWTDTPVSRSPTASTFQNTSSGYRSKK